ncbi:ABC transporter permease [Clostridium botulinum]|uniref:ABC transporter permease protein n=1 Tax=Clostridium botulinum (strain Eklund 17B / Type B) TaxID=935198 RepID=B2TJG3_CLOBB|nr:ABC transporter permease [Clostridium sp. ZBS13]ACD22680.1 putative ABC transporter permease protein [Clostridium botulinum B str. Eklund 17B (NRP)]MBY6974803.1 ABC transporter permease [Clostridium botulinum]MBY6999789.1 ABC transporter permease [Clostridium botulinum]MCR1274979.1 ABC transporter permease [Clostridium botulinum]NFD70771.1 ABC transporter permease [Clostridium botulinum]
MYVLKNAMKNIWRNKGRNSLIGIIILGIIVSTVVAFSINTTTDEIIKDYKNRFGSEVTLSPDMEKLMSQSQTGKRPEAITNKQYFDFAKSEYIKESIFKTEFGVLSKTLKAVDSDVDKNNGMSSSTLIGTDGKQIQSDPPKIKIVGNSDLKSLEEFNNDKRKIIEGEIYKEKDECVVSKEFAELNNIKVGDIIDVNRVVNIDEEPFKLKVSGIYLDATDEYSGLPFKEAYMNRRNEILTSFETAQGMYKNEDLYVDAKYFLKNPDMLKDFEKEIRAKGLPNIFNVATDEASYNKIVGPVEGLSSITLMFVLVVLGLGSIILVLLNTLSIKERKYEIGVLRAIGMKKWKVASGLISEALMVTVICLGIGIGVGSIVAQPVSNTLLQKQIASQKEAQNKPTNGFMITTGNSNGETDLETISEIDVKLNGKALLEVTGIALLIVLLSSAVGVSYITKYEPRKILTERG